MKASILLISLCMGLLHAQQSEQSIDSIRTHFQWINAQKDYTIVELNNDEYLEQVPDQGAQLKGYFKQGRLYKIVEWIGLNRGNIVTEYYLWQGKLIFVYQRESLYKQQMNQEDGFIGFDYSKSEITFESRLYLNEDEIFENNNRGTQALMPSDQDFVSNVQRFQAILERKTHTHRAKS